MLTEDEIAEIDREGAHYPTDEAMCIEALKIVQEHRGWVTDEAIEDVAGYLGVSEGQLESVATFFNLLYRKPVGQHVILVCDSVSCWMLGQEELTARLEHELGIGLGETTDDERFTLLPICCLGDCDRAPVMMIDESTYEDVTPDDVPEILRSVREGGS